MMQWSKGEPGEAWTVSHNVIKPMKGGDLRFDDNK